MSDFLTARSIPWPALAFALAVPVARFTLDATLFQVYRRHSRCYLCDLESPGMSHVSFQIDADT